MYIVACHYYILTSYDVKGPQVVLKENWEVTVVS
jgi:hypothetical protein